jgi:hypothetical protein
MRSDDCHELIESPPLPAVQVSHPCLYLSLSSPIFCVAAPTPGQSRNLYMYNEIETRWKHTPESSCVSSKNKTKKNKQTNETICKKNKILSPKKLDQRSTISPIQEEERTTMPQTWTVRVEERGPLDSGDQTQQQQT